MSRVVLRGINLFVQKGVQLLDAEDEFFPWAKGLEQFLPQR